MTRGRRVDIDPFLDIVYYFYRCKGKGFPKTA
jgi:hypothetical protein